MLTKEQLEQRKHLITATDASAICGVNPWRTPLDVYLEKVAEGPIVSRENYRMKRGNALERLGLEVIAEHRGMLVRPNQATLVHPILTWLGATPDGLVHPVTSPEPIAVAEVKSVGPRTAKDWSDDAGEQIVPDYYLVQVQVQMSVTRLTKAHLAAMLDIEDDPRIYDIEHDSELEAAILEECDKFRRDHIEPRKPPAARTIAEQAKLVRALFPRPKTSALIPSDAELELLASQYLDARDRKRLAETELRELEARLCTHIGEAQGIEGITWRARWGWREGYEVKAFRVEGARRFDFRRKEKKEQAA